MRHKIYPLYMVNESYSHYIGMTAAQIKGSGVESSLSFVFVAACPEGFASHMAQASFSAGSRPHLLHVLYREVPSIPGHKKKPGFLGPANRGGSVIKPVTLSHLNWL